MASRPRNSDPIENPAPAEEPEAQAIEAPAEMPADPPALVEPIALVLLADETGHGRLGAIVRLDADAAAALEIEGKARRASADDIAIAPIN